MHKYSHQLLISLSIEFVYQVKMGQEKLLKNQMNWIFHLYLVIHYNPMNQNIYFSL